MDISLYEVIRVPLLSEKAQQMNHDLKKLVLEVHPHANKILIKQALKKLFDVDATRICVQMRKGKRRNVMRSRLITEGANRKIAIITLKKGQMLDLYGSGQGASAPHSQASAEQKTE